MAKKPSANPPALLQSISVAGYKSIRESQTVEFRPLTLLAGANSGGKSSLMQPLLLLKQTLEAPFDPGPLLLNGQNVRFTAADQLLPHRGRSVVAKTFDVAIGIGDKTVGFSFRPVAGQGFDIDSVSLKSDELNISLSPESDVQSVVKMLKGFALPSDDRVSYRVVRDRFLLAVEGSLSEGGGRFRYAALQPGSLVEQMLLHFIHVPGLRGNPQRTYPTTGVGRTFPGTFENYVASVVQHWQAQRDGRLEALSRQLEHLGLTWKVQAARIDDTQVELRVGRLPHPKQGGAHDLVSIADVGFGVSQTLPVLVALLAAEPGQVVYLEQPEIHLHPKAQRALGAVLAEAARRGVIVIVETHSALLLRAIQTLVAKDGLPAELVKLHWVSRSDTTGFTTVASADLDEAGAFGNWPADFDETALASEDDYLTAAEAKLAVAAG